MKTFILPLAALLIIGLASCADNDPPPVEKETTIIKEKEVPVKEEVRIEEEPGTRIQVGDSGIEVESKDVDVDVNTEEPKK